MRISGQWYECDDGGLRPIVRGEILNADGNWEPTLFLVDTGADCTVFCAATFDVLGVANPPGVEHNGIMGLRSAE